ncbi:hypothetical protein DFH05DRAFT_1457601 [Lentinula detonsa]|uniref:Secreted protein n=1 Tax=Lentinula detonsa TaxID=2804962 RepID=A0A9W8U060_9AGAR|nr:hypothetical protein DFH05DRAFT_1457601 [Lentinula detonsa]
MKYELHFSSTLCLCWFALSSETADKAYSKGDSGYGYGSHKDRRTQKSSQATGWPWVGLSSAVRAAVKPSDELLRKSETCYKVPTFRTVERGQIAASHHLVKYDVWKEELSSCASA